MVTLIASVLVIGYLYKAPLLYGSKIIPVSLPTAICFLLFGYSLLREYRLQYWTFGLLKENTLKIQLLSWFLPIAIGIVILQGFLTSNFALNHNNPALTGAFILLLVIVVTVIVVIRVSAILDKRIQKVENALRKSEERSKTIFEQAPLGIALIDAITGRFLNANLMFTKISGRTMDYILSNTWMSITHPEDVQVEQDQINLLNNSQINEVQTKIRYSKPDGTIVWVNKTITPFKIDDKANPLHLCMIEDITNRKEAEQKIRDTQLLLQSSIESPKDMIILSIDKDYQYLYFNTFHKEAMINSYGTHAQIGINLLDCITNEEDRQKAKANYDRALAGESHITIEEYGEIKRQYFETRYNPIINDANEIIGATAFSLNITEKINAEIALQESEERYRRITAGLTDYQYTVIVKNGKASETIHSEACLAVTGYSAKEFADDPYLWYKMILPDERERVTYQSDKILKGIDLQPFEHRIICKDSKILWISDTPVPKYNSDGELVSYDGVIKDITERKNSEILLREKNEEIEAQNEEYRQINEELYLAKERIEESEKKYRQIFEATGTANSLFDRNCIMQIQNKLSEKFLGMGNEAIGRSVVEVFGEKAGPVVLERMNRVITSGVAEVFETEFNLPSGRNWFRSTYEPVFNEEKEIVSVQIISQNITDIKKAEEALKESKEKFSKIFDRAPVLISITDFEDGTYIDVNSFALAFSGYTRDEVIGRKSTEIGWISDHNRKLLSKTYLEHGKIDGLDLPFITKNGKTVYGLVNVEKIILNNKECLLTITTDITLQKHSEVALRESKLRYQTFFELGYDGVVIIDPETATFTEYNDQVCKQLGYTRDEFSHLTIFDLEDKESIEQTRAHIEQISLVGTDFFETRQRTKQGKIRDVDVTAQIIEVNNRKLQTVKKTRST
jgi:PAS domain S-box-containing protein